MEENNHLFIDIPESNLDFSVDSWKEIVKRDFQEIRNALEKNPDNGSPAYYTWFLFFLKYGRSICSEDGKRYIKEQNTSVFNLIRDAVGLEMTSGGAYTIGYKFYDECIKNSQSINAAGISIQIQNKTPLAIPKVDELGSLQKIFFGAPGTGKSHRIKNACSKFEHYRITFHPDTDYASFVGSYKPITHTEQVYTNMGDKAIALKDSVTGESVMTTKITYQYVYQAFLNAYIAAWKQQQNERPQPVFLIIEEINRGNCAQIFGDIFQLLDRNNSGYSDYPIIADNDLKKELAREFENLEVANAEAINGIYGDDIVGKIKSGSHLLLPNNLYIWATMNTSDQSLFPIDSAFKRRWDWKYVKIADSGMDYHIAVNGNEYDWWEFVNAINKHIGITTSQEDKKLGYFFVKSNNRIITADKFLSKVLFFLYGDVYKDYGFDDDIFKGDDEKPMEFSHYFDELGDADERKIEKFLHNLGLNPIVKDVEKDSNVIETSIGNNFSVIFLDDDNKTIRGVNQADTLKETVKYLGLERVEQLGVICNKKHNIPLLSQPDDSEIERWTAAVGSKPTRIDDTTFYISTQMPIEEKIKMIQEVTDRLHRSIKIK